MIKITSDTQEQVLLRQDTSCGITTLTMNRPKKFNALSNALLAALQSELELIAKDRKVRVIILSGKGEAFCAGHDLAEMLSNPAEENVRALFQQCSNMMLTLTRMPQPIIARVHGLATAAGCQLVAQSDLAVASDKASFATSGIGVGLFCGTPSVAITRNLPRKQAMELLLTGEFIDPVKAMNFGLINKVCPHNLLDKTTNELAKKVAQKGPEFVARGKRLFYTQIESGIEEAYKEATTFMIEHFKLESTQAGLKAFLDKKPIGNW